MDLTEEKRPAALVWDRAKHAMYREAFRILQNRADAEDAVMDAMERIVKNERKFSGLACNDSIALAVMYVRNTAIDLYRANQKRPLPVETLPEHPLREMDPEDIAAARDGADRLLALVRVMPPSYRDVLLLKVRFGYGTGEIAAFLGLERGTVRTRLSRAKAWLKEHGKEWYEENEKL